jgi:hypothetical protein
MMARMTIQKITPTRTVGASENNALAQKLSIVLLAYANSGARSPAGPVDYWVIRP